MRLLLFLLLFFALLPCISAKRISKKIKLKDFHREGPFIFLTKMVLGTGPANIDITYYKQGEISSQSFYNDFAIGMVNATMYKKFIVGYNCAQKQMRMFRKQKFHFKQQRTGMKHFKVYQMPQSTTWYFYAFSCKTNLDELINNGEIIRLDLRIRNSGSDFEENDNLLVVYIVLFLVWLVMILRNAMPMAALLSLKNPDPVKIIVYGGLIFLGMAYLYRLLHLGMFWYDGSGISLFLSFYYILKTMAQAVISTMLIAISWGWTIVHLRPNQYYVIVGVVACLINVVGLILASLTEEHEEVYHQYQTVPGVIVMVIRMGILGIFGMGIWNSLRESSGKIVNFIRKLGYIGGIYLMSWPLTVIIAQLFLPQEQHRNVITFVEEVVHICAVTLMCNMISDQESAYRKVSLHEDDNPLRMDNYKMR